MTLCCEEIIKLRHCLMCCSGFQDWSVADRKQPVLVHFTLLLGKMPFRWSFTNFLESTVIPWNLPIASSLYTHAPVEASNDRGQYLVYLAIQPLQLQNNVSLSLLCSVFNNRTWRECHKESHYYLRQGGVMRSVRFVRHSVCLCPELLKK